MMKLHVLSSSCKGMNFVLTADRYTVGRIPTMGVYLPDPAISTYHCELLRTRGGYGIQDAESTNGIRVNNIPTKAVELHHGDIILIGAVELYVDLGGKLSRSASGEHTHIDFKTPLSRGPAPMDNHSPFSYAEDKLMKLMDKMNIWVFILLGISMLGLLIWLGSIMFPDRLI
jgi:predicted component of type VI protein secretion system